MDIKGLLEIGKWSGDIVEKTVVWNGHTFEVNIKKEITPADFEFIYATPNPDDPRDSQFTRRVSRTVILGDEPISFEYAKQLKTSLVIQLIIAIGEAQKESREEKKD